MLLLSCALTLNSLDRNAVTLDNILSALANLDSIYTASELFPDSYFDPNAKKTWWQVHWKKAVQWIVFAAVLLVSVVLMCVPGTQAFGAAMFMAGMKAAISGYIIGAVVGGISAAVRGGNVMEGIAEGAVYGFINGFSAGAILFCASQGITAIANAAKAKPAAVAQPASQASSQSATVQPKKVPNPYGKAGGPAHQAKIAEVAERYKAAGYDFTKEVYINEAGRYADLAIIKNREIVHYVQVGRVTKSGAAVAREIRAIRDIQQATMKAVQFISYM